MNSFGTEDLIGLLRSQDLPMRTDNKPAHRYSKTRNVNTYNMDMHRTGVVSRNVTQTMGRVEVKSIKSSASCRTGQPYDWDLWWTK